MNETVIGTGGPGAAELWANHFAPALRRAWARYGAAAQWLAFAVMGAAAAVRMVQGFYRLLFDQSRIGAIDLGLFLSYTQVWFSSQLAYIPRPQVLGYPPASYALLWPLLGWLDFGPLRWWWAATTLPALAWLALIFIRETQARTPRAILFIVLIILSEAGTSVAIGNGQLPLHLLPAVLAGTLLIVRNDDWRADLAGAALLLFTLVKPTLSAPFVWIVLFVPGRLRPALLVGLGYVALTLLASAFQQGSVIELLRGWTTTMGHVIHHGHANLANWLADAGLESWLVPAALAALAARLWTYHAVYDDVLVLVPMMALIRLIRAGPDAHGTDAAAGLALAAGLIMAVVPTRFLRMGWPFEILFEVTQAASWLAMAAVLAWVARRQRTAHALRAA